MRRRRSNTAIQACLLLACALPVRAAGPDVIVHSLHELRRWDRIGTITAYSIGTTSCNIGDATLSWDGASAAHPVISQNLFRLKGGRFEQIGLSWLKHSFSAGTGGQCGTCQDPMNGTLLGIGCSDAYSAPLNGLQTGLGPRFEVNASTGVFPFPFTNPAIATTLDRRIQVQDADIDPAVNGGALYFGEGQYIAADDAAAGNGFNNASYRRITVSEQPPGSKLFQIALADTTQVGQPAIRAWQDTDAAVSLVPVDVPGDGRFLIAGRATNLGDGFWGYEYAVQNLNSDRAAAGFRVPLHFATALRAIGFHDIACHSGEPFDSTDWPGAYSPPNSAIEWRVTQSFGQNSAANALRWGTLYNFRFECNSPPVANSAITLVLFKPGAPASTLAMLVGPSPVAPDCNGNTTPDYLEIQGNPALDCDGNGNLDSCDPDCNGNLIPDACDITAIPARDCNNNGKLDVCEIAVGSPAPGGPFFCTANCAPDCNHNGKPDSCDIASGFDPDCNGNSRPDSCDIALGETDCDGNDIPDACEIAAVPSRDCNRNGQLDVCGEVDCNNNTIPDDCEGPTCTGILAGDQDCNGSITMADVPGFVNYVLLGVPSCRADMNHDGRVDGLDVAGFKSAMLP